MSKGYSGLFKGTKGSCSDVSSNQVNFYVGANGKALEAKYKKWIGVNRRDHLLKKAKDQKLKNAINHLYRASSFIGDGGTASVLKFEFTTGIGLGKNGNTHEIKARETIRFIDKKILSNNSLSNSDRKLANSLKKKLLQALGGKKHEK